MGLVERGHAAFRQDASVEQRVSVASLTSSDENELGIGRAEVTNVAKCSLERLLIAF